MAKVPKMKRRHHWVPQFYLSYFAIPETRFTDSPSVWAFSNTEGEPFSVRVENIANKRYLYSPVDISGNRSQEFEDFLGEFEGNMASIWEDISEKKVRYREENLASLIAYFVATMYLRNIRKLAEMRNIRREIVSAYEKLPKTPPETGSRLIMVIGPHEIEVDQDGFEAFRNPGHDSDHEQFVQSIKQNTSQIADGLLRRKWSMLESTDRLFVTSDNPVTTLFEGSVKYGIAKEGNRVFFPISPRFCLCIHDDSRLIDGQYYFAKNPEFFNFLVWRNTEKHLFSPRHTDEVLFEMKDLINQVAAANENG